MRNIIVGVETPTYMLKELIETIDKCYKNPFLLVKELVLNIALDIVIYPTIRFINKFRKESKK